MEVIEFSTKISCLVIYVHLTFIHICFVIYLHLTFIQVLISLGHCNFSHYIYNTFTHVPSPTIAYSPDLLQNKTYSASFQWQLMWDMPSDTIKTMTNIIIIRALGSSKRMKLSLILLLLLFLSLETFLDSPFLSLPLSIIPVNLILISMSLLAGKVTSTLR